MRKLILFQIILTLVLSFFIMQCSGGKADNKTKDKADQDTSKKEEEAKNQKTAQDAELVPVEVTTVSRGDISDYILLSSNLETEVMADVYSRVQGIVEDIQKEEGQFVQKGEVMLTLEAKEYELAEQRAKVQYEQQFSNYKRFEAMHEKSLLSYEEFERSRFNLEAAEIQWKEAKLNLDYTQIKSPISGRVGERLAKIGKRIQPVDKLFSVVDNSQVIAVVYVPEKNLNKMQIGQRAMITSDHLAGERFDGVIKRISPVIDPASGTFKVTVGVNNRSNALRPGMFVNVHIIIETHHNVVLIPKTAIVYENEWMNAYVVRDSLAYKIRMSPGFQDNEKIESLQDIQAGEKVIVVGQAGMKDKTKVKVVSERENRLALGTKEN